MNPSSLLTFLLALSTISAAAQSCAGAPVAHVGGLASVWTLTDNGGIAAFAPMNVNLDGYGHAYHPENYSAGALLHLCNAGKVYLPDGTSYEGSANKATCTGRFMSDFAKIRQAGWKDPSVGAVNWYGILGQGSAIVHGRKIASVQPITQKDGSGFYVSPTSLFDPTVKDEIDQDRYINPLRMPSAVVPSGMVERGIKMGTFGVAMDAHRKIAVPFVVGDGGPRIGEGSAALARLVAGQPLSDQLTRKTSTVGQVDKPDVLWVFFGGHPAAYDHTKVDAYVEAARTAFESWGGEARLQACLATVPHP